MAGKKSLQPAWTQTCIHTHTHRVFDRMVNGWRRDEEDSLVLGCSWKLNYLLIIEKNSLFLFISHTLSGVCVFGPYVRREMAPPGFCSVGSCHGHTGKQNMHVRSHHDRLAVPHTHTHTPRSSASDILYWCYFFQGAVRTLNSKVMVLTL